MNLSQRLAGYPLGILLFALVLAFYKAVLLTMEMGVDWYASLYLVGFDAFFLALLFFVAMLQSHSRSKLLHVALWFLLAFLTFGYLLDSFVLLALDEHVSLFDFGRYSLEWGIVRSFFDVSAYGAMVFFLLSLFFVRSFTRVLKRSSYAAFIGLFVSGVLCAAYGPTPLARYSMLNPVTLLEALGPQTPVSSYTTEQLNFYAGLKQDNADIPASKPNIILLVIESLSSINSKKISGQAGSGLLDGFDELAENGLLFRNFFANHQASEGGLISLLGGYPPIHFPSATPYMFDEFAIQPSVMAEYQQQGYFVEFLTNSDLGFIGLNQFLDGLGLDSSRGRDEVDGMRDAVRIVQDAPSDALLYTEALIRLEQLSKDDRPFLLTMATTSTHLPYRHPEGGPDSPAAVWDWSMRQLTGFYRQLSEAGYFEGGILLVTGDHRQMKPLTRAETERYGGSARARVPLLLIGKAYPAGVIDERFFQQSDLLRMLGKIQQDKSSLSPQPIWVERYNRKYGHIELIDSLSVFDETDSGRHEYRLNIPGNRIEWLGDRPKFARKIETSIHTQRSLHQAVRAAAE
jgi:phosphoglycerol transferase MdoB-like AlkP superfamily enzyme